MRCLGAGLALMVLQLAGAADGASHDMAATAAATTLAGAPVDAAASGPIFAALTEQPRPFGYVVGDLLSQRVLLEADGHPFEPATLPPPARLGAWFERRGARLETGADGRRWLVVEYQVVNAPAAVARVRLASWELAGRAGALRVPAWDLTVAPLTAAASAPLEALRADRPAPLQDVAGERRRLVELAAALTLCLLAWLAWVAWRDWRARRSQPFAQALQALRSQPRADASHTRRILHAAFDRTASEVVRTANLSRLFERAPHLAPLRERIARFFAQSEAFFFAGRTVGVEESPRDLCRDLQRLERAAER